MDLCGQSQLASLEKAMLQASTTASIAAAIENTGESAFIDEGSTARAAEAKSKSSKVHEYTKREAHLQGNMP